MLHLLSMSPLLIFPEECIGRGAQVPCCLVLHPLFPSVLTAAFRPCPTAARATDGCRSRRGDCARRDCVGDL